MKLFKSLVLTGIGSLLLTGCAGLPTKEGVTTIAPADIYETCAKLVPNQALEYSFEASNSINFKILYRSQGNVFYSYTKDNVLSDRGVFYPEREESYCVDWSNLHNEPVNLSYSYSVRQQ